jgi:tetratricopeptide (TPR) repeat protein
MIENFPTAPRVNKHRKHELPAPGFEEVKRQKALFVERIKSRIGELISGYINKGFEEIKEEYNRIFKSRGEIDKIPSLNFRIELAQQPWFKNLDNQTQERIMNEIDSEIAEYILHRAQNYYEVLVYKFLKKQEDWIRNFFNEIREAVNSKDMTPDQRRAIFTEKFKELDDEKRQKVLQIFDEFKKTFGFYPGEPETLRRNCAGFNALASVIYHLYGYAVFKVVSITHTAIKVDIGGNEYIADVNLNRLIRFNEYEEALKQICEGRTEKPNIAPYSIEEDAETLHNMAILYKYLSEVYREEGKKDEADKLLRKAINLLKKSLKTHEGFVDAYINLGNIYFNQGKYNEAQGKYEDAVVRYRLAVYCYKKAIKFDPSFWLSYYCAGVALCKLRRYKEAEELLEKAAEINPDSYEAHYWLGIVRYVLKNYEEAIKALSKAMEINPNSYDAYYYLGLCYYFAYIKKKEGKAERQELLQFLQQAENSLQKALEIKPDSEEANQYLNLIRKNKNYIQPPQVQDENFN